MRLKRFAEKIKTLGLDYFLISNMPEIRYFTGFTGSSGLLLVCGSGDSYFLTDRRYATQSKNEVKQAQIFVYEQKPLEGLRSLNIFHPHTRLGIDPNTTSLKAFNEIKEIFPDIEIVQIESPANEFTEIKDEEELCRIREAIRITEDALRQTLQFIAPGVSEKDIAIELEYRMKKLGASGLAFPTIVVSGARSALVHGQPSEKPIQTGELLLIDLGAMYDGYAADITRTFAIGKADKKAREIYQIVLDAQKKAIAFIREGICAEEIDRVARDYITSMGYGENFQHSLGHGLGFVVHTSPRLACGCEDRLRAGMVTTVEPGIYVEEFGGVRIEDDILVKAEGCELLTTFPKDELIVI